MKLQTLKGFRDFLPLEAKKRQYVINTFKSVFESYGFEPLETPALEYDEVLQGKYGQEGDKLMYRFKDNGGRNVALRYDQTVPLARVVAQYGQKLPMPFKRYQIQPVWRAENTQKGRYREFLQCDIDTVGTTSPLSDAEIIDCALSAAKKLGFKNLKMAINDRKIFEGVEAKYLVTLDKLPKIGKEGTVRELTSRGLSVKQAEELITQSQNKKPTKTLEEIFFYLENIGYKKDKDFVFDPLIVRGLDYYTGAIFELVDINPPAGGPSLSLAGGGRFDNLIGIFAGRDIPAVGIAFGFDRVIEAMDNQNLFPQEALSPTSKVLVTVFDKDRIKSSLKTAAFLRDKNIATEIYPQQNDKLEKQLKYANRRNIPFVIIIGQEEARQDKITLKNMAKTTQETLKLEEVLQKVL